MFQHSVCWVILSPTILFGFGVEDMATPLCEVRQHAEHSLGAEL